MIKELFLAIFLGALLGFGATGGYYTYKNSQAKATSKVLPAATTPTPESTDQTPSPTITPQVGTVSTNSQLTITSPTHESLVNTPIINLKGSTAPNSTLVILTPKKVINYQVDSTGNFNISNVDLEAGINLIQVSSVDPNDNQSDAEILVTYSSAKF